MNSILSALLTDARFSESSTIGLFASSLAMSSISSCSWANMPFPVIDATMNTITVITVTISVACMTVLYGDILPVLIYPGITAIGTTNIRK